MSEKSKEFCLKLGEFSANPENGTAFYSLPIKIPKGSNDFNPVLSLNYSSKSEETPSNFLGTGWRLAGVPNGEFDGQKTLLQNGEKTPLTFEKSVISHLSSTGVTTYFEFTDKKQKEFLRAIKQVDPFGNQILFRYGKAGELSRIDYGCRKTLNRSVLFTCSKDGQKLLSIQSSVEGEDYIAYQLDRAGQELRLISSHGFNNKGELENCGSVGFSYLKDRNGSLFLQRLSDAAGFTIETVYDDRPGILKRYTNTVCRPRGKKVSYSQKIMVSGDPVKIGSRLVYPSVSIGNDGAGTGVFFEYATEGNIAGALTKEGQFAISNAISLQKEYCFTQKQKSGGEESLYPLISQKEYSYLLHPKTKEPLVKSISSTQFIQPGKAIPPQKKHYTYDDTGLLSSISDGKTEEHFDYIAHPSNKGLSYLCSRSCTDLSGKEILSDTRYKYEFNKKSKQISSIGRCSLIEGETYSNPEVISLDEKGLIAEKISPAGLITQYRYDSYQNTVSETAISEDKKKTLSAHTECHPATGNVLTARSFEGSIYEFSYDSFGQRVQIKGFDPSNPESWKKDTGIVPLSCTAYVYDPSLKARVEISRRPGKRKGQMLEKWVLFDGMQRPTAEVTELETGSWLVVSIRYDDAGRETARSLPHRLKAQKKTLTAKLSALDAQDLKWVQTEYDPFGREETITYPDGSRLLVEYCLSDKNCVLVKETSVSADGKNSTVRQQLFSADGHLLTSALGEQLKDRFDYDELGRKIRKTDINGCETNFKWNALDFCVAESNPVTGNLSLSVDQKLQIDAEEKNGDCLEHEYDWLGRRIASTSNKDGKIYQTLYDEDLLNRSTSVTHVHPEGWSSTYRFSPTGQEIEKTLLLGEGNSQSLKSLLYPDGSVASRLYPDGRHLELGYSDTGWISSLGWKGQDPLARFEDHDLYGKPATAFYANGVTEKSQSDPFGNLQTFSVFKNSRKSLLSQRYSYGGGYIGMVTALEESRGGTEKRLQFNYDPAARLESVSDSNRKLVEQYEYGKSDNITQFETDQVRFKTLKTENTYQIADYIGADKTEAHLSYSKDGDVRSWEAANQQYAYSYDAYGNMQKCTVGVGKKANNIEFVREQSGNQLCRITSNGQVCFKLDDDFELSRNNKGDWLATAFIQNENGCVVEATVPFKGFKKNTKFFRKFASPQKLDTRSLSGSLTLEEKQAGDVFLHLDVRGSSLLATNADGKVLASLQFTSYGQIDIQSSSGVCNFTPVFAGMLYDADLSLYDAGARYFNPEIGIFISPDPLRESVDPYAYPADPVNYYDDRGECGRCNWRRRFSRNCGRGFTVIGWMLTAFFVCILFYLVWDTSVFGMDAGEAFRWGLSVGIWFATGGALEMSLLKCSKLNKADTNCKILLAETSRFVVSSVVGGLVLPPMGCFIGASPETPVPWDPTNCSLDHYLSNIARGMVVSGGSSIIKSITRLLLKNIKSFDKSVFGKYVSGVLANYGGYISWQGFDTIYMHYVMKMSLKDIWGPGKLSFATGEIFLGLFFSSPNMILAIIPASLCQNFTWNWCATPGLQVEGGRQYLPICPCSDPSGYVDLDDEQDVESGQMRQDDELLGSSNRGQTEEPQQRYGAVSPRSGLHQELLEGGTEPQQSSASSEEKDEVRGSGLEMTGSQRSGSQEPSSSDEQEQSLEDKDQEESEDPKKSKDSDEDTTD